VILKFLQLSKNENFLKIETIHVSVFAIVYEKSFLAMEFFMF